MLKLIASSGSLLLMKSVLLGIRVMTLLAVAKFAAADELASLSFAIAMAELARMLADFGTETWSVRSVILASSKQEAASTLGAAGLIKLGMSLILWPAIIVACVQVFPDNGLFLGTVAGLMNLASQGSGLAIAYYQAHDRIHRACVLVAPYALVTVAAVAAALIVEHDSSLAIGALTAGEIAIACSLLTASYRDGAVRIPSGLDARIKRMMLDCLPTAALGIVVGIYGRLDTIFLSRNSLSALAVYTVAYRLFQPPQVAITTFGTVIYAKTAAAIAANLSFARNFALRDLPMTLGLALALSALLWYVGRMIIDGMLPSYSAALPTLQTLCLILPILACNAALTGLLLALGRFTSVFVVAAVDLIAVITVMAMLIPARDSLGAAQSLAIGAVVNLVGLCICVSMGLRGHRGSKIAVSDQYARG